MSKININDLLAQPNLINQICDNIASGGSLIDLCNTWQVRYCDVMRWVNEDTVRKADYAQAINDRGEWFIQRVLQEIKDLAFIKPSVIFNPDHTLKPVNEWPEEIQKAISSIEVTEEFNKDGIKTGLLKKVRLYDKLKSIEMIGKNMFMFVEKKMVMNGDNTDSKFRDEFFGLGKKQQGSTTTGATKIL